MGAFVSRPRIVRNDFEGLQIGKLPVERFGIAAVALAPPPVPRGNLEEWNWEPRCGLIVGADSVGLNCLAIRIDPVVVTEIVFRNANE